MLNTISGLLGVSGVAVLGDYESIATTVVGSGGQTSVTFSSIPSTYKHLQIRATVNGSTGMSVRLNSDTGSNYTRHYLYADGVNVLAGGNTSQTSSALGNSSGTTNIYAGNVLDILDYASSNKYKTMRCFGGKDFNGSGTLTLTSGLWMSTSAITSITIFGETAVDWQQHSHFALYGIKG